MAHVSSPLPCKSRPSAATNYIPEGHRDLLHNHLPDDDLESRFKHWLVEHGGAVLRVARAYTYSADDCQDLAQEILLQVWRSLPQFQGRASAATWAYRVALNTALTWRRDQRRRQDRQQPIVDLQSLAAGGSDSANEAAQRELVERLYAAIRELPKGDAALVLLYLDGLTYRQMAEVLGISENNVGVKLNRARQALTKRLREDSHGT
jgi:RNA polymerase sigma-70 factor (ECF subfamily)